MENFLKTKIEEIINLDNWQNLYWDNIAKDNIKNMNVSINKINCDNWFEIDNLEDLKILEESILV